MASPIGTPESKVVALQICTPGLLFRVQSWTSGQAPPSALLELANVPWPAAVGASACGRMQVMCVGPAEWLLTADADAPDAVAAELERACGGTSFRVTDVSQAVRTLQIGGARARDLISKACGLDMHPREFGPATCARTRFAQVAALIRCANDGSTFDCIVARSQLAYVLDWLTDAAAEFSAGST